MTDDTASAPITIRASRQMVNELDALAATLDRSRNYLVNQAIQQYLETHAWQIARIEAGVVDAREGRVERADQVFTELAAKHGFRQ
jgi:predicted transcriptional regulator